MFFLVLLILVIVAIKIILRFVFVHINQDLVFFVSSSRASKIFKLIHLDL